MSQHTRALELAKELTKSSIDELEVMIETEEKRKRGPAVLMFKMFQDLGEDKMKSLPVPGTDKGNNADKYETLVDDGEGGKKTVKSSFYSDMAEALPDVRAFRERIRMIKLCEKDAEAGEKEIKASKTNLDILAHSTEPVWLGAEERLFTQRCLNAKNYLARAAKCFLVWSALSEHDEAIDIQWDFADADKLELRRGSYPVTLVNANNVKEFKTLTANEFLRIDVTKAAEMDGGVTWANVVKTLKRGTKSDTGNTNEPTIIPTTDKVVETLYRLGTTLDGETDDGRKAMANLMKSIESGKKDRDQRIYEIGLAIMALDPLWKHIEKDFYRVQEARINKAA